MSNRMLRLLGLVAALFAVICLSGAAFGQQKYRGLAQPGAAQVGTEEPCILNPCLMYAGDFDINGQNPNGLWNANNTVFNITGTVFIPITVPKKFKGAKGKTDWNVQGLFVNELMEDLGLGIGVSSVSWSIVQGVAEGGNPGGGQVKTICSGTGTPSVTPTGRSGFGLPEVTILITGISCPVLEAGSYWMTLLPTTPAIAFISDVEDNSPVNIQGPGTEPVDSSFFVSSFFGFANFANTTDAAVCGGIGCDSFSAGVVGTAVH
ncbi:MAG TPA: hypothetical protein VFT65_06745 [Candidatus Angelobacter sp.]|nr:hypothetical protein [Candidatus Angelobacter sp.]